MNKYPPRLAPRAANFRISENGWKWGLSKFSQEELTHHTEKFLAYADAHGKWYADWEAGWRYWILEATERAKRNTRTPQREPQVNVF